MPEGKGQRRAKRPKAKAAYAAQPVVVDPRQLALELLEQIRGPSSTLTFGEYFPRYLQIQRGNRLEPSSLD